MTTTKGAPVDTSWNGHFAPYPSHLGIDALFARQVAERPHALAIDAGSERVTYAELDARASRLAHTLRLRGVGRETPVGVLMGPRVEQIVAQVAIAKAGATYVPLDPDYPKDRLAFMTEDAKIAVVVTDAGGAGGAAHPSACLCVDAERHQIERNPASFPFLASGPDCRTHILYTSGSTGRPKGIEIIARNVSRLVIDTDYVQFGPTDRVVQMANLSFDASIFEVWGALLNGATLVLISKVRALDPQALRAELAERRASIMFMTTSLFNLAAQSCPDAFSGLRYVVVGGERADAASMEAVLRAAPPKHLINGYGPTEGTTFSVACDVTLEIAASGTVPIGRPIRNTLVYILDENKRPVGIGEPGEIHIGGDGIARGYLNRPELTQERFVTVEGLRPDGATRLYRTGDQARWRSDGMIDFLGRTDFQVKVRGHRIELEEIEASLLRSGQIKLAAVVVHKRAHGDMALVAHVVPNDGASITAAAIHAALSEKLPRYMVPDRIVVRDAMPLNANGKIDRAALTAYEVADAADAVSPGASAPRDAHEIAIAGLWAALLEVPKVGPMDRFFALGGTSLLAARMVLQVREVCRADFPLQTLYESDKLRDFVAVVRAAQKGAEGAKTRAVGPETWKADAVLASDLRTAISGAGRSGDDSALGPKSRVFFTGATGFLGAFMLRDMLARGHAGLRCLVRARSEQEGLARIRTALAKYDLWQEGFAEKIIPVPGDLTKIRFGLTEKAFAALADSVDTVMHGAAQVNYVQTYEAHRAANIGGINEVIRLASLGRLRPLHHVSSIAVFGPAGCFGGSYCIREDEDLDTHIESLRYDIGYSASKWVAEKLVWQAKELGLPVRVYRPGFIMGDSRTGAGNADDFVGRVVRGMIQSGACPDLPRQRKEFVPVDFVSQGILAIAARADTEGRAFHLVPPDSTRSMDVNDFHELIRQCGYALENLSYKDWCERLMDECRTQDNPICSLIPMLCDQVYMQRTCWEMYEGMPTYDASAASAALEGSGIEHVYMDRALLTKYLTYWVRNGSLPASGASPKSA
ncbi:MAG TPA: amino acid adenylation domain-containing protein [Labilithrix sp.]|nr:amino acid adenylation domain-containing protein [Labilithrix sp.]